VKSKTNRGFFLKDISNTVFKEWYQRGYILLSGKDTTNESKQFEIRVLRLGGTSPVGSFACGFSASPCVADLKPTKTIEIHC